MYVRPHLEYGVLVWCPWHAADINTLESVQKKAVGMISGLKGVTYEEKLIELGLDSLATRRLKIDMAETFKLIHGFTSMIYKLLFTLQRDFPNQRATRAAEDPLNIKRIQVSNSDMRNSFYSQRVINYWNQIPPDIKKFKSVASFKFNYTKYLNNL